MWWNSDSEGHKNDDIEEYESIVPDSGPDSLDIEVSSVRSSEISSDHIDFWDKWNDNGLNTINDPTVIANANIHNQTTTFTDITIEPFTQERSLFTWKLWCFCGNIIRLCQPIIQTRNISWHKDPHKQLHNLQKDEILRNRNNADYVDRVLQETTVEELKVLFGIDILMGL